MKRGRGASHLHRRGDLATAVAVFAAANAGAGSIIAAAAKDENDDQNEPDAVIVIAHVCFTSLLTSVYVTKGKTELGR